MMSFISFCMAVSGKVCLPTLAASRSSNKEDCADDECSKTDFWSSSSDCGTASAGAASCTLTSYRPALTRPDTQIAGTLSTASSFSTLLSTHAFSSDESDENSCKDSRVSNETSSEVDLSPPKKRYRASGRRISQPLRNYNALYNIRCCDLKCLHSFSPSELREEEMMFKDLGNESKQKQYIIDTLRQFSSITCLKNRRKVTVIDLRVLGKKTCEQAWREIYNVSEKRYEDCIKLLRDGKVNVEHGNVHKKRSSAKAERALSWMRLLFERIGDWMPHKTQVHLPTSSSKKLFYIRMLKELEDDLGIKKEDNISYEYFTEIWRQHLPEFVIPKKQEFVKCNICVQLREDLARAKTAMERGKIKDLIDKHVQQVEIERRVYHNTREQARTEPDEVMCVIQDGMDQAKTSIPHLVEPDKLTALLARIRLHLTGNIIHTNVPGGKIVPAYLDVLNFPHDSNLSMNLLLQSLVDNKVRLSRRLFAQMDNCYRENKNRYMLSLGHLLVELNIFDQVDFHFLPVGHTHEDIDQLFSCISKVLRKTNVYSMADMERIITGCYNVPVFVKQVTHVFDIKKWLTPHMSRCFRGQSKPLCFQFKKVNGQTRMRYRHYSTSVWRPIVQYKQGTSTPLEESLGLKCLQSVPDINNIPEFVKPSIEKMDPSKLKKDIPDGYEGRIPSEADREWLRDFVENVEIYEQVPSNRPAAWYIHDLIDAANERRRKVQQHTLPSHLEVIKTRIESECDDVLIGRTFRPIPMQKDAVSEERQDDSAASAPLDSNTVMNVDSFDSLKEGMFVAVYIPQLKHKPQIGKVMDLNEEEETFKIHWYKGSWSGTWKPSFCGAGRNRKPNIESVWIHSAIFWDFSLTHSGVLPRNAQITLRERYIEAENEMRESDSNTD